MAVSLVVGLVVAVVQRADRDSSPITFQPLPVSTLDPASFIGGSTQTAAAFGNILLDAIPLPPGAVTQAALPGAPAQPAQTKAGANLVDVERSVGAQGDVASIEDFLRSHVAAALFRPVGSGFGTHPGGAYDDLVWDVVLSPPGIASSQVVVTLSTGVPAVYREDAQVMWAAGRSPGEQVGGGDRLATVTRKEVPYGAHPETRTVIVTDQAQFLTLANLFNELPTAVPGFSTCPLEAGEVTYVAEFAPAARTAPDVVATTALCLGVAVTVGGHTATPLAESRASLATGAWSAALARLFGIRGDPYAP